MSDDENELFKTYQEDKRIPCRYGAKCFQKNALHHEKYKHPPGKNMKNQKLVRTVGKKRKIKDRDEKLRVSPEKKIQRKDDNVNDEDLHSTTLSVDNIDEKNEGKDNETVRKTSNSTREEQVKDSINQVTIASLLKDYNINSENDIIDLTDAQTIISHLFLTEMPEDFFQFYEFCKSICEKDPLNIFKDLQLQLVGPYDIFKENFLSSKVDDKQALLKHWRYYYDPPEFQTIIKIDDKDGLHFGYWRDDVSKKTVFVAKNKANVDCIIEPVAENVFGVIDTYIGDKLKLATPFEIIRIKQLHQKLKNYAKEKNITLDKQTTEMQAREKKVVARTFHKAGIVVPYNKQSQLGYRDLAVTDNKLREILKQIEDASTSVGKRAPLSKLEEIIRLATIAADECDFGTCLELGHDLFSSGVAYIQSKALNILSLAYNLLQRPQFSEIARVHLKDRRKGSNLSVL